jgi:hypothetical protein
MLERRKREIEKTVSSPGGPKLKTARCYECLEEGT